jgi:hypothetical protein
MGEISEGLITVPGRARLSTDSADDLPVVVLLDHLEGHAGAVEAR